MIMWKWQYSTEKKNYERTFYTQLVWIFERKSSKKKKKRKDEIKMDSCL